MHYTLEMFSSIIHAAGPIHFCIAQSLDMSVSRLISHLTVPDLNTSAAVCLHSLLIYHRQQCNPPPFHFRRTVRSHTVNQIWFIHDLCCNSTHYCNCWDNNVSEIWSKIGDSVVRICSASILSFCVLGNKKLRYYGNVSYLRALCVDSQLFLLEWYILGFFFL